MKAAAATAMVLGTLILASFLPLTVASSSAVVSSLSDLPYDENGRLASHVLVYPEGKCADLIESSLGDAPYGFEFRAVGGGARSSFFPADDSSPSGSNPESTDDCRAVCAERGVASSLVTATMPPRRYEGSERDGPFNSWFAESCQKVEPCFVNYRSKAPINVSWVDPGTGQRVHSGVLKHGEANHLCFNSFLGHQFEFQDSETGEIYLLYTVEFNSMVPLGELPPYDVDSSRNFTGEIIDSLKDEWNRHNRVRRTFSELGFRKGRLPDDLFASMGAFYYNNRNSEVREQFGSTVAINYWEHDVWFVTITWQLKKAWQVRLKNLVEAWTGVELEQTDLYGLRRYTEGARLLAHVDRVSTHAASLIVNVDQGNLSEPWPVEINDHAGRLHQVTMEPGDIVYYESARCLHARSSPLKGDGAFYVNLFAHYRPVDDPKWFEKENPKGTPEPLIDVGECHLEGTLDQIGKGAVKCDNDLIGPYVSPTLFKASNSDDLVRWWESVGPQPDRMGSAADSHDEL